MRGELFAGEPRDECCAPAKGSSLSALRDEAPNVWRQDISHNARFMLRTTPRTKQSVTKSTRFLKKKKEKKCCGSAAFRRFWPSANFHLVVAAWNNVTANSEWASCSPPCVPARSSSGLPEGQNCDIHSAAPPPQILLRYLESAHCRGHKQDESMWLFIFSYFGVEATVVYECDFYFFF